QLFFFTYIPTTHTYTLSLHDALPIYRIPPRHDRAQRKTVGGGELLSVHRVREQHIAERFFQRQTAGKTNPAGRSRRIRDLAFVRSEEHTSELQSQSNLVCRLLLEKKK